MLWAQGTESIMGVERTVLVPRPVSVSAARWLCRGMGRVVISVTEKEALTAPTLTVWLCPHRRLLVLLSLFDSCILKLLCADIFMIILSLC